MFFVKTCYDANPCLNKSTMNQYHRGWRVFYLKGHPFPPGEMSLEAASRSNSAALAGRARVDETVQAITLMVENVGDASQEVRGLA
ncbi:hypothetical protein, partial [Salmonella sp. M265]|uniref:hypothetical protein n=1 Tax=Salmonella sp. M265 TaxID=3240301 RepID=UPI00352BA6D7